MNPRTKRSSLAANPVLIGAATILIAMVAMVLAYNANKGLPFVKTYDVKAQLPDASGLIVGNDVRKGGARIGAVSKISPRTAPDGSVGATISLKLDDSARPLPVDSVISVRPRSALGLKYVQLVAGKSKKMLPAGGTITLEHATSKPVELNDFFTMFDEPTRTASQENLLEFGNAIAGRGPDLNRALKDLLPLVEHLEPAMRNIMRPETGFTRFFPALAQAAGEAAPVADQQAEAVVGLHKTFAALASVREDLQQTIAYGPAALQAGIDELPKQASFLNESTELFRRLRPAFASLSNAAPSLAGAITAGVPALRRSPDLNKRVVTTLEAVDRFGTDPSVLNGISELSRTVNVLKPTAAFITPPQTVCNYYGLLTRNLASSLSEASSTGSALRAGVTVLRQQPGSEAGPASVPANGPPMKDPLAGQQFDSFLHSNPNPNTASPGQEKECEAGNEPYTLGGKVIGNVPGNQGVLTTLTKGTP